MAAVAKLGAFLLGIWTSETGGTRMAMALLPDASARVVIQPPNSAPMYFRGWWGVKPDSLCIGSSEGMRCWPAHARARDTMDVGQRVWVRAAPELPRDTAHEAGWRRAT